MIMKDILFNIDKCRAWLDGKDESFSHSASLFLENIKTLDREIKAFAFVDEPAVKERAALVEKRPKSGKLWGLPIALKNNICLRKALTTCCSRILENFRPIYDAHVVERLSSEGALLLEGLNMDEFAFGSSCETSCYGPTRNPLDTSRIPGGSSGGAAAAVAAGEVAAALGSDTGGSIRQPASMCGVVGLKPTYGRVSRYGLIAFASSLDQIGPVTRNVTDSARMLEVIAGYDKRDSTSVNMEVPSYTENLNKDIKGLKIGVPREYFSEGISSGVRQRIEEAVEVFRSLGAEIYDVSLPHTKYAVSCYYIIGPAEASSIM